MPIVIQTYLFIVSLKIVNEKKIWLHNLGLQNAKPWHRICSNHFKDNDFSSDTLKLRILNTNAVPHSNIDKQIYYNTIIETENDENVSFSKVVKDVESDTNWTLEHNISSPTTPERESFGYDISLTLNPTHEQPSTPKLNTPKRKLDMEMFNKSKRCLNCSNSSRFGDLSENDILTPRRTKRNLKVVRSTVLSLRSRNKVLAASNRCLKNKVTSLKGIINSLSEKRLLSDIAAENLKALGSDILEQIICENLKKKTRAPYSEEIKKFSVTLQYYSPKAYLYVRKKFNNLLPHPRTLRRWFMIVNGQPGFTKESLDTIKNVASKETIYCNLVIDEMSIRRRIEMGVQCNNVDGDVQPEAKNALMFLIIGINGFWKLPIGYFFINGLSGAERSNLLETAIALISETGANLHSVTFDGAAVSMSMVKFLGANFDIDHKLAYILNKTTNEPIFVFFRCSKYAKVESEFVVKYIQNAEKKIIKWEYIEKLYQYECKNSLRAGTKLTSRHIQYFDEKMNVRLAAQTMSQSVADALIFFKSSEQEFCDINVTAEFIIYINNTFDILNSLEFVEYKKDGQPCITKVLESNRKTGFMGLIRGLINSIQLIEFLIPKNCMTYLLTYKLSQDHIETTFSAIRSRGGYNNNPTCRQFAAAYKRILVHDQVVGSVYGNCRILDNTKHLSVSEQSINETNIDYDFLDVKEVGLFIENVSYYIAGFSVLFLTTQVKMNLYQYKISFQLSGCDDNHSIVDTHKDQLTKLVIQKYLYIRMFHEIRKRNDQTKIRSKYTKLILFKNQ
ncbi:hypothetical protein AGLY_003295 [Aphis glycines]|uniref:Uncharacterized protein n=1 Tax=Aphis glycines TaxID=307491 RepID=A0A6G0U046_APHGL|nr:hypothetical protein AGLY_003295 [Aphis glycines]